MHRLAHVHDSTLFGKMMRFVLSVLWSSSPGCLVGRYAPLSRFSACRGGRAAAPVPPAPRRARGLVSLASGRGKRSALGGTSGHPEPDAILLPRVEETITRLAQSGSKAWPRLRPLVALALGREATRTTLADIGTDHGLLAFGLAASGKFASVIGVDVSARALQDGALSLLQSQASQQQQDDRRLGTTPLPSFRVGDGLHALEAGECQIVCIAGMGVNSMQEILAARTRQTNPSSATDTTGDGRLCLDDLGVEQLVLQPTNSRPRNLIALYDFLYRQGWISTEEQLVALAGRWYLTTSLERRRPPQQQQQDEVVIKVATNDELSLPVEKFPLCRCVQAKGDDRDLFQGYLQHHCPWLRKDEQQAGRLRGREDEWLANFEKYSDVLESTNT